MQEPWKTDKWFSSPWSYLPEVRQKQAFGSNLKIHDVTLRDGEQQTAVVFRREEKVAIAKKLDSLGIHRIEAGMPASMRWIPSESSFFAIATFSSRRKTTAVCCSPSRRVTS